ncbi:hypothetical protein JYA61_14250 [Sphingomonas pseudosanguinis]|uniref:Uncharacterized protein n=2 Tax=Sphingomonas pseudosanguinis TaxID=413712 RepID=A0A7W6AC83_9SPHN|nr:hypothetical protein [Sphingomonas pseudosanguinis]MBB3878051.1 hypothetical protein [Sphingomonas pseudosanguinis]MBN3537921.1 hypothetical protein [Sphingomonas pseudosanguinis]
MTSAFIMYAVAAVLGGIGAVLLLQLRYPRSDQGRYARLIAGTMFAMGGIILAGFASALRQWSIGA